MPTSRIVTIDAHPAVVFDSLLGVIEEQGLWVHMVDHARRQVVVGRQGKPFRVSASVTDNGYGKSCMHFSWHPPTSGGGGKTAKRLEKQTSAWVRDRSMPPDAPG